MRRSHITQFTVEFGDCDPAQIVFYPNFFRWFDSAARHFFVAAGLPPWRDMEATMGIIGAPIVDASARFLAPATYGQAIEVETAVSEWRGKSFVMKHTARRGEVTLAEGQEIRIFARRHPNDPERIQAIKAPDNIRKLLE